MARIKCIGSRKAAQSWTIYPSAVFVGKDLDLTAPWVSSAVRMADKHEFGQLQRDLEVIREHVYNVYEVHKARVKKVTDDNRKRMRMNKEQGSGSTDLPIELRQDVLRASAKKFALKPTPEEVL